MRVSSSSPFLDFQLAAVSYNEEGKLSPFFHHRVDSLNQISCSSSTCALAPRIDRARFIRVRTLSRSACFGLTLPLIAPVVDTAIFLRRSTQVTLLSLEFVDERNDGSTLFSSLLVVFYSTHHRCCNSDEDLISPGALLTR